ncbi:hypothetical protein HGRIS_000723 [Hohenbuehelia grisea]|uniref:Uncharacterized protein n=1 Tax=Hohenbuehelia grisea TaxID=104357 RepID=A0ABR3IPJ5_9AGAR
MSDIEKSPNFMSRVMHARETSRQLCLEKWTMGISFVLWGLYMAGAIHLYFRTESRSSSSGASQRSCVEAREILPRDDCPRRCFSGVGLGYNVVLLKNCRSNFTKQLFLTVQVLSVAYVIPAFVFLYAIVTQDPHLECNGLAGCETPSAFRWSMAETGVAIVSLYTKLARCLTHTEDVGCYCDVALLVVHGLGAEILIPGFNAGR